MSTKIIFEAKLDNGRIRLERERVEFENIYTLKMKDNDGNIHQVTTSDDDILNALADFIKNN